MKRGYKGLLDNKIYIMGDKNLILEDVRGVGFQVPKKSLIHVLRVVISHYLYLFTNFSVDVMSEAEQIASLQSLSRSPTCK